MADTVLNDGLGPSVKHMSEGSRVVAPPLDKRHLQSGSRVRLHCCKAEREREEYILRLGWVPELTATAALPQRCARAVRPGEKGARRT